MKNATKIVLFGQLYSSVDVSISCKGGNGLGLSPRSWKKHRRRTEFSLWHDHLFSLCLHEIFLLLYYTGYYVTMYLFYVVCLYPCQFDIFVNKLVTMETTVCRSYYKSYVMQICMLYIDTYWPFRFYVILYHLTLLLY